MPTPIPRLGHALVDRQHRRIAELCRSLLAAIARSSGEIGALGGLIRASQRHFSTEDRLMEASGYPDRAGHRTLHEGVGNDMQRMREHLRAGRPVHPRHVEMILDWLVHHTDEADRNLIAHLGRRPQAATPVRPPAPARARVRRCGRDGAGRR